jgi:ABC-type Fe3+-hydroxamate transport system substrate-binding protein
MIAPVVLKSNRTGAGGGGISHRARRRGAALALALLAAAASLALSGCGERTEPTGATVRLYPVQVESSDGQRTVLTQRPTLVVTGGSSPAAMVRALGVTPLVSPVTATPTDTTSLPAQIILKTPPNRVLWVATTATYAQALSFRRSMHFEVYVAEVDSLDGVERSITNLGLLLGKPLVARSIVARIARERSAVETAVAGKKAVRVFFDLGQRRSVAASSLIGGLLAEAGAASVAGPEPGDEPVKATRLVQLQPEVYLTTRTSGVSLAKLRKSPRLGTLPAIRNDRFVRIPSNLLIAGPQIGDGLRLIALAVHPDAFR